MLYDSTVNDLKAPGIYVTFHDAQACTHRATPKEPTHPATNARRPHACPGHDPGHVLATPTKRSLSLSVADPEYLIKFKASASK